MLEAQLSMPNSSSVVLVSPVFQLEQARCLSLKYRLNTDDIELSLQKVYDNNLTPPVHLPIELTYYRWVTASFTLEPTSESRLVLTGRKTGNKLRPSYVHIDEISMDSSYGGCAEGIITRIIIVSLV